MIALIDSLTGIIRLEHALRTPDGYFADTNLDLIVSLDPAVRNRAYKLGWPISPVVYNAHHRTRRQQSALNVLSSLRTRLLRSPRFDTIVSRYFVTLHVIYRSIQTQLMGDPTTNLQQYEEAIRDCLRDSGDDVAVVAHGPLVLLAIANLHLATEKVHVL